MIENPPGNLLEQLGANPDLKVNLFPSTRVDFLQVPLKTKPFDDVKVRQAVKAAIDLDALSGIGSVTGTALDELLLDAATVGAGRSLRA